METIWSRNVCAHVDLDCKIYKYSTLFQLIRNEAIALVFTILLLVYSLPILHITKTMLENARIIII